MHSPDSMGKGTKIMSYLKNFINDQEGQDLVEYALLLAFVAVAATAVLTTVATNTGKVFNRASVKLT